MKSLIIILVIISTVCCETQAALYYNGSNIGNVINDKEYPDSSEVLPKNKSKSDVFKAEIGMTIEVNLDDCIKLALGNNPRIQSAMQDVFASDARVSQVWSNFFPQFSWQTGYSRIRQLQLSDVFQENLIYNFWVLGQISASQLLYDFGVTQNQATIRKIDNLGYKIILTGTINDVVYIVKDAYYALLYEIQAAKIAEQNLKEYEEFYNQAKSFYNVGVKPKVDVTIAEVNLSNAKLKLIQAEHAVKIAMARLNNAIGIPYNTQYDLTEKLNFDVFNMTIEEALKIAEKSRPEFMLAEVKVEQAKQNVKLVKKNWLPQFITQGQFEVGGRHPDSNYGYTFGAYINFPTVNGMLLKHQLREARSLYSKEQANAVNTKNNIYLEIQNSYYVLDEKRNKIPVANLAMKQAKENYELSNGRYHAGIGNPLELNNAQIQYSNAQLEYYRTLYEYKSARSNLEKNIGRNISGDEVELKNYNS